jgi:ATP-dependent DNA helicase RecG
MPSSIDKIQKFLRLESERGYDNRAIVGGLDKILPSWMKEARTEHLDEVFIRDVADRINSYSKLEPPSRAETIKELQKIIQSFRAKNNPGATAVNLAEKPIENLDHNSQSRPHQFSKPQRPVYQNQNNNGRRDQPSQSNNNSAPVGLNAPLTVLPGIGVKYAKTLKTIGLNTLGDLLYYFPRRYDDYSQLKTINRLVFGEEVTIIATVQSSQNRPIKGGRSQITEVIVSDGTGYLRLSWFNSPWLTNRLKPGIQIVVSGRTDMYLGRLVMTNPEWEPMDQDHLHTNRIAPVYPLTGSITQHFLRRAISQTVKFWAPRISEFLPEEIRSSASLMGLSEALAQVHFPDTMDKLKAARNRLAFDEIFFLQLGVLHQKQSWQSNTARIFTATDEWVEEQVHGLPFSLTNAQQRALQDLRSDLASGKPMNRLLQGDVGSGKTIVAALAISIVVNHGAQAALMAPTGILAEQHYRNLLRIFTDENENGESLIPAEQIRLLVGDTPESEKRQIREGLADGSIKVVIGTHALIEDPVTFQQLQFVIIDEQHRFGVSQRAALRAKGENPHLLVMTATPIPRSLALTVYGDLDLTVMDEMPPGRQPVETFLLHPLERERAYNLIRNQIYEGHQAFIIYPFIEKGEREDDSKAAIEEHNRLQNEIFPKYKLGLLHGRLRPEEKDHVMAHFRDGDYQVMVSTSVVEVGVDVPNATLILIEGANRFGLSQLHQFRGRVGRGQDKAFCMLIPETEDSIENERLAAMTETNDGFELAERDLQQRGPGDFLGTRQSGFAEFRMANLTDVRLIEKARNQAIAIFEKDPELSDPKHAALLKMMRQYWGLGKGDVS